MTGVGGPRPGEGAAPSRAAEAASTSGNARILFVDDDAAVRDLFAQALSRGGWTVETASDGREAVARLGAWTFEAILSDIAMPGMDGVSFLKTVREHDLDVPVILITGAPTLDSAIKAVEYGAFHYLSKPVAIETLEEIVARAVRLGRLSDLKRQALELLGDERRRWLGDRAGLEVRFERALASLWTAFQPVVAWRGRIVYGYEALVRSAEPSLATPAPLLEAAERLGRTRDLGRAIRSAVAAEAGGAAGGVRFLVNLHPEDLGDPDLYAAGSPLSGIAGRVILELTEREPLDQVKDLRPRLAARRSMGYRIAMDDLGAGSAGLSALAQMEPDLVKLDVSLVRGLDALPTKERVVRSIVGLCWELGIVVIAEGVETPGERDAVAEAGCDLLPGYLFARPGPGLKPPWL